MRGTRPGKVQGDAGVGGRSSAPWTCQIPRFEYSDQSLSLGGGCIMENFQKVQIYVGYLYHSMGLFLHTDVIKNFEFVTIRMIIMNIVLIAGLLLPPT